MAASAGSGKTRALSERYIDFLLSPTIKTSARNILAITFTNKAAGEMKNRIIYGLKEIALSDSKQKEAARKSLNELLDRFSDLKVQTIDSFLASITMSSALELGLPPRFEIVLDSSGVLDFVLDELLAQVWNHGPKTPPFLDLVNELLQIGKGPGWDIKRIILDNVSSLRNQEFLMGRRLKRLFSFENMQERRKALERSIEGFLKMDKDGLNFKQKFINAANRFVEDKSYQPWESKMFLKEHIGELCKKDSIIKPSCEKAWEKIRGEISTLAEMAAHCRFAPFINIVALFDEGIQSYKGRQQVIFIEDLNLLLERFLSIEGIIPEIYFHLGDRIHHFFIDEFQDTSRLQWQSLFPLIEETLSKRGSLFYVGDKKQAIYGFRGGESALFDEAKEEFLSVEKRNIKEEAPEINYRSRANIVEFVNKTFCPNNLICWAETEVREQGAGSRGQKAEEADFDLSLLLKTYAHVIQNVPQREESKGGLVRVERISPDEPLSKQELDVEIGKHLVGLIQNDIMHRFSPGDIAILVRTNTEASLVTGILTSAGIPVASEKTLSICSNNLIQEIVSFLKFLDSPIDDFAFACFISGEIFLKATGLARKEIFSFLLENREGSRPLYTIFREGYPGVWRSHLEEHLNAVGFLPPYDLISRILKKYRVFQDFPGEEGFFFQLLEVLKQKEAEGKNSLKAFLDLWYGPKEGGEEFQVVLPAYTDAIRVLTIHKAKGLGFRVIISPFTYLENKSITEVYEREGDELISYRINQPQARASSKLRKLRQERFTSQLIDELNTFYVCLTRAEDELYILLPNHKSKAGKFHVPILLEVPALEIGSRIDRSPGISGPRERRIHPELVNEWQDKLYRPLVDTGELVDAVRKRVRERGTLIHNFLARIERLTERWADDLEEILDSLGDREREIVPLMRHFFDKEDLRKWFVLPAEVKVYCEKEMVDGDGLVHRVDRLLVTLKEAVVIEFKSGEPHSKEHQEQVTTYLRLLSGIYPDRTIEGWLIYVDEASQEKVEKDRDRE